MNDTIYINGRFLTSPLTGINRFAYELCLELSKLTDICVIVPKNFIHKDYDVSRFKIIEYGCFKSHIWEQFILPLYFAFGGRKKSLLLNLSGIGPILFKNKISTIHDVSFLHNKKWFSKSYYYLYKIFTPLSIKTSKRLFTVSEFSKNEILKYYPFANENRIDIIYNAVRKEEEYAFNQLPQTDKYILAIGSLDPRKNFSTLCRAMEKVLSNDVCLHIVGGGNQVFNFDESLISSNRVKFLGRISDEELKKEFLNSILFVQPSLYEGFGIPPLEALAYGKDIAISDIPVFREIFEDAAIYFDPNNPNDIAEKINDYLDEKVKIDPYSKERVLKKFSWEKSADKIVGILTQINDC